MEDISVAVSARPSSVSSLSAFIRDDVFADRGTHARPLSPGAAGRTCGEPGCGTILNSYHGASRCYLHARLLFGRRRKRRRKP